MLRNDKALNGFGRLIEHRGTRTASSASKKFSADLAGLEGNFSVVSKILLNDFSLRHEFRAFVGDIKVDVGVNSVMLLMSLLELVFLISLY